MEAVKTDLYERIKNFPLDTPNVSFPFSHKVAKENGWTLNFTQRVIEEYRRFVYLAMTAGHMVVPSEAVDQVWHMHMVYTKSYWEDFCGGVLGKPFHHYPSSGGSGEQAKYFKLYQDTLASYEQSFGAEAPSDIWPDAKKRFTEDLNVVRVNKSDTVLIRKDSLINPIRSIAVFALLLLLFYLVLPRFVQDDPLNWIGTDFLRLYIPMLVASAVLGLLLRFFMRDFNAPALPSLDLYEAAYLRGGKARVLETATISLYRRGFLVENEHEELVVSNIEESFALAELDPIEAELYQLARASASGITPSTISQFSSRHLTAIKQELEAKGYYPSAIERWWRATLPMLFILAVAVYGSHKLVLGLLRERPIGFLAVLVIIALALAIAFWKWPFLSSRADASLKQLSSQYHRKAKRDKEKNDEEQVQSELWLVAFASIALTEYSFLRPYVQTPSSGGDGFSSDSGGGDGGGGDGGGCGGCGGCGGG